MTAYPTAPPSGGATPVVQSYRHVQNAPASTWVVAHALGFKPAGVHVELVDGSDLEPDVEHIDENVLHLHIGASLSGEAIVS